MDFALPPQAHVFVDESKAGAYYIAAAVIPPADVAAARCALNRLRHKGSSSVHFKSERDAARRAFLTGAAATGVKTVVYVVKGQPDKVARPVCLKALVQDLCRAGPGPGGWCSNRMIRWRRRTGGSLGRSCAHRETLG